MRTKMKEHLNQLMLSGLHAGVFTAGAVAVGLRDQWHIQTFVGEAPLPGSKCVDENTLFDLASLTKIISPTMIALRGLADGTLTLQETIGDFLPHVPEDKAKITLEMLLMHTAGFVPGAHLYEAIDDPAAATDHILSLPLVHTPGTKPLYSCTGFILLGKLLELRYGKKLDVLSQEQVFEPLGMKHTCFCPKVVASCAATECLPDGEPLIGIVHDENARFLGGVSGNAGLFMPLSDGCRYASMLAALGQGYLRRDVLQSAIQNKTPGQNEHRGLGFQIAGTAGSFFANLPDTAFGHTGFTGTSLLVEPDSGLWILLLTNRVYPTRSNTAHIQFRKTLHRDLWNTLNSRDS